MATISQLNMRHRSPCISSSSDDDSDSKWGKTCHRIEQEMSFLKGLGAKTKPPSSHNRFASMQQESDKEEESEGSSYEKEEAKDDPDESQDHSDFQTVAPKRRKAETKRISLWRSYTEEECQVFSDMYNAYFEALTGEKLGFVISPASQPYVSVFEACMERDFLLSTLFNKRPVIVDPMGGCGSDSCAMMFNLYPESLWVCEYIDTMNERRQASEYSLLTNNMTNMISRFPELDPQITPGAPVLHMRNMDCREFLSGLPQNFHVDILYLDPNWIKGGPEDESERTPEEMVDYIKEFVIDPMTARGIYPKCIVYKTRYLAEVLWPVMQILSPDYHPMYSIEAQPFRSKVDEQQFQQKGAVKGRFHWVVIVHNELRTEHWHKSQVYKDLLMNGKDVLILKKDRIGPNHPMYTARYRKPVESDIRDDEEETFLVKAPKRLKRTVRDTHRHNPRAQHNVGPAFHFKKGSGQSQQNTRAKKR